MLKASMATRDRNSVSESTGIRAMGYAPELNGRGVPGVLTIDSAGAHFKSESAAISFPIAGLQLRRGGHNNEHLFLEHGTLPGWLVSSADDSLLRHPRLISHPEFASKLRGLERARGGTPLPVKIGLVFALMFVAGLVLLFLSKDRIVDYIVDKVPMSFEQSFGARAFEQVKAQGTIVEESEWKPYVEQITSRLLPVVKDSGYEFQFHIMQDTNVNAFAMPGGYVVILTGLLEEARSGEEVAGVLAHEIAHVTRRHSLRNVLESAGLFVLLQAVFGDTSGLLAVLTEGSSYLLQQQFSRSFEREADDYGWKYLVDAKIDPRGMTRFFETLRKSIERSGASAMEGTFSLLSTHPTTSERIQRLEQKWEQTEPKTGFVELGSWKTR